MPDTPRYPIIYVRGYAMTKSEITETTSTPYMGLELGSTKARQAWDGAVRKVFFESPIVRLLKAGYSDIYREGLQIESGPIAPQSVIIHRYYDVADPDFGSGKVPSIVDAAKGLSDLVLRVRDQVCSGGQMRPEDFKVYLVAHSMGGLVCRCFLQNSAAGSDAARKLVDKVFTYATPHNGIEMAGMNVPAFFGLWDMNNFNRDEMRKYLDIKDNNVGVNSLDGKFDPRRFFCLVGTNSKDYDVARGASRLLAGELSDGLVRIENAYVTGAPRAHVHRSHSGPYGIVNSEEGFQNLARFLFGDVSVDGVLAIEALPLPPTTLLQKLLGKKIGYYFEVVVATRGALDFDLTRRTVANNSAMLRSRSELFDDDGTLKADARQPHLFSTFLDLSKRPPGSEEMMFTVQLAVSMITYAGEDTPSDDHFVPGEYLFRDTIVISATPPPDKSASWQVGFVLADSAWSAKREPAAGQTDEQGQPYVAIPLQNDKGFKATLRLYGSHWA
ncbi:MAG: lipase family alpha/beta hydrolase [Hyphomicrobiaceae bacterium]